MPKELLRDRVKSVWLKVREHAKRSLNLHISEADTRAKFVDPLLAALAWDEFEDTERERAIPHSGERVDYVLKIDGIDTVFIEAKPLGSPLIEKDIVQVIQYASVAGVRWCLLTNGIQLKLYDQFNPEELTRKFVFEIDLVKPEEEDFGEIFGALWLLSKEAIAQGELDFYAKSEEIRGQITELSKNQNSPLIRFLEKGLKSRIRGVVSRQEISHVLSQMILAESGAPPTGAVTVPAPRRERSGSLEWTEAEIAEYLSDCRQWAPLTYNYYKFLASHEGKISRDALIASLGEVMDVTVTGYSIAGVLHGVTTTVTRRLGKERLDWSSEGNQEFSIAEKYRNTVQKLTAST